MAVAFSSPVLLQGEQEGAGQQDVRHVSCGGVPPPGSRLVLVQPRLALAMLELGLHCPAAGPGSDREGKETKRRRRGVMALEPTPNDGVRRGPRAS